MFPSKTPILFVLHALVVLTLSLAVAIITKNPLALLGLTFMPQIPVVANMSPQAPEEEESNAIGFTADV